MIKSLYKIFYSKKYTAFFVILLPIFIIGFSLLVNLAGLSVAPAVALVACAATYFGGDYFTFNGIVLKDMPFGIMKCSVNGGKIITSGINLDMILHFIIQYIVVGIVVVYSDGFSLKGLMEITMTVLILTALEQAMLNALRYVSNYQVYGLLAPLAATVPGIISFVILLLIEKAGIVFTILGLVIAILLTAVTIFFSKKHIERRYQESFKY